MPSRAAAGDNFKIFTEAEFEDEVEVGWGFSGLVLRSRHRPSNSVLARKIIHQTPRKRRELFQPRPEIEYYKRIMNNDGNIVKCHGVLRNGARGHIHGGLVFEFMDLGSLSDFLQRTKHAPLPESIILRIAEGLLQACHQLETLGIVHRDIKPSNILINSSGAVKLCDFGEACYAWESSDNRSKYAKMATGSTAYMAPERLACREHSHPADIWSLGLVLLELTCPNFPFATESQCSAEQFIDAAAAASPASSMESVASFDGDCAIIELWESVMEDSTPLPQVSQPQYSKELALLVDYCLLKDPTARPSSKWLLKKFSHYLEKHRASHDVFIKHFK